MPRARTGSVERHLDHFDIRPRMPNGKLTRRACLPPSVTLEQARAEVKRLTTLIALHGGELVDESPAPAGDDLETVDLFSDRWMKSRRGAAEASQHLRFHVFPLLMDQPVNRVTRDDLEAVVLALDVKVREGAIAWKTARNVWGTVTKMFDDACHHKDRTLRPLAGRPNPCDGVRGPDKGAEKQSAWLFPREARALLDCPDVPQRWRILHAVALYSGMRLGELRVVRVGDVVLGGGYLNVHKAQDRENGGAKSTKGKRGRRVPIEPALLPLLERITKGQPAGAELFPWLASVHGGKVSYALRRHLGVAKLDREELHADDEDRRPLTFHDLRHTYGTWCALRGDAPLAIQYRLGHADMSMTQRYIEAAEVVGHGDVGEPLGPLPERLSQRSSQNLVRAGILERDTGFEPATFSLGS